MFKRLFRRFTQDEGERRAESIRDWAAAVPGTTRIEAIEPRSVAKIAGVVKTLRVRPREGLQAFEADVTDGSGTVTAVWLGRRGVPGLSIGSRIVLEGRLGGEPSRLQVVNPSFEFAPGEH